AFLASPGNWFPLRLPFGEPPRATFVHRGDGARLALRCPRSSGVTAMQTTALPSWKGPIAATVPVQVLSQFCRASLPRPVQGGGSMLCAGVAASALGTLLKRRSGGFGDADQRGRCGHPGVVVRRSAAYLLLAPRQVGIVLHRIEPPVGN